MKEKEIYMESAIQVFRYKGAEVRTEMINGEPWWVAKDVCDILGHSNSRMAIQDLDDDEKGVSKVYTPGGMQDMTVISEAGLYTLMMRSNKDEAKPFRRWVTHEVLPQIRKTGSYSVKGEIPATLPAVIAGAKAIFEMAGITGNQGVLALDKVFRSYTGRSALEMGQISLTAPTKKQILTPTEIGAEFGLNAQRVNEILAGAGYQHKVAGKWEALLPGEPYAVMLDTGKKHSDGTPVRQLKWDSGILAVFRRLQD